MVSLGKTKRVNSRSLAGSVPYSWVGGRGGRGGELHDHVTLTYTIKMEFDNNVSLSELVGSVSV
jgi:hypothetical protein